MEEYNSEKWRTRIDRLLETDTCHLLIWSSSKSFQIASVLSYMLL